MLAFALPLLWIGALSGLRWANAGILLLEDGVLTVRNLWSRRVLEAPVSSLTGLHTVRLPLDGVHTSRIIMPWRQVHFTMFTLLIVIGAIVHIALVVTLPFLV